MISKIKLLKTADKLLGSLIIFFAKLFINPENETPENIFSILIIRPGGIGDAVLLIPAIKILKKHYPGSHIDILAEKRNSGIFKNNSLITNLYLYDDFKTNGLFKILKNSYQVVIDTEQWHKLTSIVTYLTKAPVRIGFSTNGRTDLYSHSVEYKQSDYESVSFLNLVSVLTGKKHRFNTNGDFLNINNKFENEEFSNYKNRFKSIVGLFTGAKVKERRWGVKKFTALAENLMANSLGVVILGGKDDLNETAKIERILDKKDYLNLAGKTSLLETVEIISNLDLLISSDSGLMHIAYGAGTSTLSLFGAGIQEKWAPKGNNNHVINRNLACSPCTEFGYTPDCPIKVKCLAEISVEEVCSKALEIIAD